MLRFFVCLLLLLFAVGPAAPQAIDDVDNAYVNEALQMINAMQGAVKAARAEQASSGVAPAEDPVVRLSIDQLWKFGREHRITRGGELATAATLRALARLARYAELRGKTDTLPLDDRAWDRAIDVLVEAATASHDFSYVIDKLQPLVKKRPDARLWYALGRAYAEEHRTKEAAAAFEQAAEAAPGSDYAEAALGDLQELRNLGIGKIAPAFSASTLEGGKVSLSALKGKVVLLDFWASY